MFDTRGPKLSDAPQQWSAEGVAEKASASISASLEELAKVCLAQCASRP